VLCSATFVQTSEEPLSYCPDTHMSWRCPACRTEIRHNPADPRPDPHSEYRCHVCRLDLRFDVTTETMTIAPLETDHQIAPPRKARTIPPPVLRGRKTDPTPERD
jgi:hypothetical protein